MLKPIKTVKSGVSELFSDKQSIVPPSLPVDDSRSFIGYSESLKGHLFISDAEYHKPVLSPSTPEVWNEDSTDELTTKYRRDFHTYLEVSLDVQGYQMRPVEIPFVDARGTRRKYRPLFLLHYWDDDSAPKGRRNLLADIRCDASIRKDADWFIPAWRAASRFAHYKRLDFRVFRDSFFLSDYFSNVRFANNYRWFLPDEENWRLVNRILEKHGEMKFSKLIDLAAKDKEHKGEVIRVVWALVAMGCIGADWNKRFNGNTILWGN